jgi:hypothetical protein
VTRSASRRHRLPGWALDATAFVAGARPPATRKTIRASGLAALGLPADRAGELERLPPLQSWPIPADARVLTDDRVPVELLTDRIILDALWRSLMGA